MWYFHYALIHAGQKIWVILKVYILNCTFLFSESTSFLLLSYATSVKPQDLTPIVILLPSVQVNQQIFTYVIGRESFVGALLLIWIFRPMHSPNCVSLMMVEVEAGLMQLNAQRQLHPLKHFLSSKPHLYWQSIKSVRTETKKLR